MKNLRRKVAMLNLKVKEEKVAKVMMVDLLELAI
jgi:hypothetical protein